MYINNDKNILITITFILRIHRYFIIQLFIQFGCWQNMVVLSSYSQFLCRTHSQWVFIGTISSSGIEPELTTYKQAPYFFDMENFFLSSLYCARTFPPQWKLYTWFYNYTPILHYFRAMINNTLLSFSFLGKFKS